MDAMFTIAPPPLAAIAVSCGCIEYSTAFRLTSMTFRQLSRE